MAEYEDDPYDLTGLSLDQLAARVGERSRVQDRIEVLMELAERAKVDDDAYAVLLDVVRKHPSAETRTTALEQIPYVGRLSPHAVDVLGALLFEEKSARVKLAAVEVFAVHFTDQGGLEPLIPALLHVWRTSRGAVRDHADTAVRLISGRFAADWTP